MQTFKRTLALLPTAILLLLPTRPLAQFAPPSPPTIPNAAQFGQQMQTMQMQNMNAMMWGSSQVRNREMLRIAESSYRSIMRNDSTPPASSRGNYLADDFFDRAPLARSFSVLPVEVQSFLFDKQGLYLGALIDSALQQTVANDALDHFTFALTRRLKSNQRPIVGISLDQTCQRLESLGFTRGAVADTTLRALFDCLGTDLLILPRVVLFAIGTKHAKDAIDAGAKPDSAFKITVKSSAQGVFLTVEVAAYDRQSLKADGQITRALWRSPLFSRTLAYIEPLSLHNKPRAAPDDYWRGTSELSAMLAEFAALRDPTYKKLLADHMREQEKQAQKNKSRPD